jgi:hypothetical protein
MKPPSLVVVGGEAVPITAADNLGRFDGGYRVSGDYKNKRVRYVKGQTPENERATVLHELMHYLWERGRLEEFLSVKTEELVLVVLDSWLMKLLKENPALREYLFEEED